MSQGLPILDRVLLPVVCPVCGAAGAAPCPVCRADLRPAPRLAPPAGVDRCEAAFSYEGVGRSLVIRLKYRNARAALPFLARSMAALVEASTVDVVTWAPTAVSRRRDRGFDQAQLLARAVARHLGLPCRSLLRRRWAPAPQTGRTLAERRRGPAFESRGAVPSRVLVVDDVVTSGATVSAAARALREGGATDVHVVVAARTPLRPAPGPVRPRPDRGGRTLDPGSNPAARPVAAFHDQARRDGEEGALPSRSPRGVEREVRGPRGLLRRSRWQNGV